MIWCWSWGLECKCMVLKCLEVVAEWSGWRHVAGSTTHTFGHELVLRGSRGGLSSFEAIIKVGLSCVDPVMWYILMCSKFLDPLGENTVAKRRAYSGMNFVSTTLLTTTKSDQNPSSRARWLSLQSRSAQHPASPMKGRWKKLSCMPLIATFLSRTVSQCE